MVRLAAPYGLGLSVEETSIPNRDICLTNKIFTYLLAGLPVLLSATTAQTALAKDLGDAAWVVELDKTAIAAKLDHLLGNPQQLKPAHQAAWHLGQHRFNWDVEKQIFLSSIAQALKAV